MLTKAASVDNESDPKFKRLAAGTRVAERFWLPLYKLGKAAAEADQGSRRFGYAAKSPDVMTRFVELCKVDPPAFAAPVVAGAGPAFAVSTSPVGVAVPRGQSLGSSDSLNLVETTTTVSNRPTWPSCGGSLPSAGASTIEAAQPPKAPEHSARAQTPTELYEMETDDDDHISDTEVPVAAWGAGTEDLATLLSASSSLLPPGKVASRPVSVDRWQRNDDTNVQPKTLGDCRGDISVATDAGSAVVAPPSATVGPVPRAEIHRGNVHAQIRIKADFERGVKIYCSKKLSRCEAQHCGKDDLAVTVFFDATDAAAYEHVRVTAQCDGSKKGDIYDVFAVLHCQTSELNRASCSCPVGSQPPHQCKHIAAMLLLYAHQPERFDQGGPKPTRQLQPYAPSPRLPWAPAQQRRRPQAPNCTSYIPFSPFCARRTMA